MRMFLEHGFDNVSVIKIAAAAGVSVQTVYNYFPAKADLVFDEAGQIISDLQRAVRHRPPGQSALSAIRGYFTSIPARVGGRPPEPTPRFRWLVRNSPVLRAYQREIFARFEQSPGRRRWPRRPAHPPTPSSRSSRPPGWSASSGSTSKAATATQNPPGNVPNAPSTSSNTASATTPSRPPHHLPRRAETPDLHVSRRHHDPPVRRAERRLGARSLSTFLVAQRDAVGRPAHISGQSGGVISGNPQLAADRRAS